MVNLLDQIGSAVRQGRFDRLATLMADLESLAPGLDRIGDLTAARTLKDRAVALSVTLEAALAGVRAARQRMTEVSNASSGFLTYQPGGRVAHVGAAAKGLHQRV